MRKEGKGWGRSDGVTGDELHRNLTERNRTSGEGQGSATEGFLSPPPSAEGTPC